MTFLGIIRKIKRLEDDLARSGAQRDALAGALKEIQRIAKRGALAKGAKREEAILDCITIATEALAAAGEG